MHSVGKTHYIEYVLPKRHMRRSQAGESSLRSLARGSRYEYIHTCSFHVCCLKTLQVEGFTVLSTGDKGAIEGPTDSP